MKNEFDLASIRRENYKRGTEVDKRTLGGFVSHMNYVKEVRKLCKMDY